MPIKFNVFACFLALFPLALPAILQALRPVVLPLVPHLSQPHSPTQVHLSIAIGTSCLFWDAAETSSQVPWRWPVGRYLGNRFS